jgi:hypothetical protein
MCNLKVLNGCKAGAEDGGGNTVRSLAENSWLECGVVGDVMPCDRYIYKS